MTCSCFYTERADSGSREMRDKNRKSSSPVSQLVFSPYIFSTFLYNVRDVHNHSIFTVCIIQVLF